VELNPPSLAKYAHMRSSVFVGDVYGLVSVNINPDKHTRGGIL
jgi:hypothetical protein